MKNILHISDIHASGHPTLGMTMNRLVALKDALIDDLKKYNNIDTIFITGDIANSGDYDEYQIFNEYFLEPLILFIGINKKNVFVVPGNHDLQRNKVSFSDKSTREHLIAKSTDELVSQVLCEKEEKCEFFKNFVDFRRNLDQEKKVIVENEIYSIYDFDGIGIACLNTAWLAYGEDEKRLLLTEYQLSEALKRLRTFDEKILLMHHPLDWLEEKDRDVISKIIHSSGIRCVIYGHMHQINVIRESHFSENAVLKLQAGKMDCSKSDEFIGYSLISLHERNIFDDGVLYFRKLNYQKNQFEQWNARLETGEMKFSIANLIPFDNSGFSKLSLEKINSVETDLLCNTGLEIKDRKKLSEIYIDTPIIDESKSSEKISQELGSEDSEKNERKAIVNFSSIVAEKSSVVLLGGENSGKSTVGKRLLIEYLKKQSNRDFENFVFYIDVKDRKFNSVHRLKNELIGFYSDNNDISTFRNKLDEKIVSANAVIIIDSIERLDRESTRSLVALIEANSKAKYILLGQSSARGSVYEKIQRINNDIDFKLLTISNLSRSNVRELINKWSKDDLNGQSNLLSRSVKIVNNAGMPNNPFVYSMLMAIYERNLGFKSYMHETDLVENFIEILLRKHCITVGNVPQYKDLLLFLGAVAEFMQKNNSFSISGNELKEKALEFNRSIDQNFDVDNYIDPILASGIIVKGKSDFEFSQACFFNYVFANFLSVSSKESYGEINSKLDFLRFDKVVEYLSAINKNDVNLIDYMSHRVLESWWLYADSRNLNRDIRFDDEMNKAFTHDILGLIDTDNVNHALENRNKSQEAVEQALDESMPLRESAVTKIVSDENEMEPSAIFERLLSLYARVFRAAEHVRDAELSKMYFLDIFEMYIKSLAAKINIFENEIRPIMIEKIKKLVKLDNFDDGERTQLMMGINSFLCFAVSVYPNLLASSMSNDFFNQRQLLRMKNFRGDSSSNFEKLIITYAICEMDGVDVISEFKSLKYNSSQEVLSLLLKCFELVNFNFSIGDSVKDELNSLITKIIKDHKAKKMVVNYAIVSKKVYSGRDELLIEG